MQTKRAFSAAGSEHLPYKQRVGGSNPSTPTIPFHKRFKLVKRYPHANVDTFFCIYTFRKENIAVNKNSARHETHAILLRVFVFLRRLFVLKVA
jgi:hypothetical protein